MEILSKYYSCLTALCFHSFQVSLPTVTHMGDLLTGPPHGGPLFCQLPLAEPHNCLSGSLLSPTSSQQHSISRPPPPPPRPPALIFSFLAVRRSFQRGMCSAFGQESSVGLLGLLGCLVGFTVQVRCRRYFRSRRCSTVCTNWAPVF